MDTQKFMPIIALAGIVAIIYIVVAVVPTMFSKPHTIGAPAGAQQSYLPMLSPANGTAPGNITLNIYESDFSISPNAVNLTQGENVTFLIYNKGAIDFGLKISGSNTLIGLNGEILPGNLAVLRFKAPAAGNYTIFSPIPGQETLGLKSTLLVRA